MTKEQPSNRTPQTREEFIASIKSQQGDLTDETIERLADIEFNQQTSTTSSDEHFDLSPEAEEALKKIDETEKTRGDECEE